MKWTRDFPGDVVAVRQARAFVSQVLHGVDPIACESAVLMTSELAANSVGHAGSRFTVDVELAEGILRVAVTDHGPGEPTMRSPAPDEPRGRGLRIVDSLADDWGVESEGDSKTVWFRLIALRSAAHG